MNLLNRHKLSGYKEMTHSFYKIPKSVQEAFCVDHISESGIFETNQKTGKHIFDKGYLFQDINYISKDQTEKEQILSKWCRVLNSLNVSFKITIGNLKRNIDAFKKQILYEMEEEFSSLIEANNKLILSNMEKGSPEVEQIHLFTIFCRAQNQEEAKTYFNVLEAALIPVFSAMKSRLVPLDAQERLKILHQCFRMGCEAEFYWSWEEVGKSMRNWKNEILPDMIKKEKGCFEMDEKYVCVLYAQYLPHQLDESKLLPTFTQLPFHMILTMDFAAVPRSELKESLLTKYCNNEFAITRETENHIKNNHYNSGISFTKKKNREDLEHYLKQIERQDENAFYMGFMISVYGNNRKELQERVNTLVTVASGHGLILVPYYYRQWEAFQTCLPAGIRLVDNMRLMLTSSMRAFQPFYMQEIMDNPGVFYGINRYTKHLIIGDRKKLANPNGVIFGIPGSGKSMFAKMEIGQVKISTKDDIFILDPQNEFEHITAEFGGHFFDFSSDTGICMNPLEIPDIVRAQGDPSILEKFISSQSEFLQAFCAAIMGEQIYNGFHTSIIDRTVRILYEAEFSKKESCSPTLKEFRKLLELQQEPEARDIYLPLEAFTDGTMNIFAQQSNVEFKQSMLAFGLKKIPSSMWKPAMMIIVHVLHNRMDFNQIRQKATWFYVDEAQEVCKDELSARELNKCFLTFRKFGGICTAIMQNLSNVIMSQATRDMISDSEFKLFFHQAGADRNAAVSILNLSEEESAYMTECEIGEGLLCWGKKVIQMDSRIPKKNALYHLYSTNFHEKSAYAIKG